MSDPLGISVLTFVDLVFEAVQKFGDSAFLPEFTHPVLDLFPFAVVFLTGLREKNLGLPLAVIVDLYDLGLFPLFFAFIVFGLLLDDDADALRSVLLLKIDLPFLFYFKFNCIDLVFDDIVAGLIRLFILDGVSDIRILIVVLDLALDIAAVFDRLIFIVQFTDAVVLLVCLAIRNIEQVLPVVLVLQFHRVALVLPFFSVLLLQDDFDAFRFPLVQLVSVLVDPLLFDRNIAALTVADDVCFILIDVIGNRK